jgi:hypothetical protein
MTQKYLYPLLALLIWGGTLQAQVRSQSSHEKTITREDYELMKSTAQSIAEDYISLASLVGVPENSSGERNDYIAKALEYLESSQTLIYNDLDPSGSTGLEFTGIEYLKNIAAFYPEGVVMYPEDMLMSDVFYDEKANRYFVKVEMARVLTGNFRGRQQLDEQRATVDFYIKFYEGNEKSATKIYYIGRHEENLANFQRVEVVDGQATSSLFTDEEKERLRAENEQAQAENQRLKDQLSSMEARLDEEYRKRLEAERKAKKAEQDAAQAKKDAAQAKKDKDQTTQQQRDIARQEQETLDKALALVQDYDFVMAQKHVRERLHRSGYDNLRRFDTESIKYFNQIPTFKVLNTRPSWNQDDASRLLGRLNAIYQKTQETMRSGHKVELSKRYQRYQSKRQLLFLKGGYGFGTYSDAIDALGDRPMTFITGQLALRHAQKGNKRGTLFGLYGLHGRMLDTTLGPRLENPSPSFSLENGQELNFTEVEMGFSLKEFWRISGGVGFMQIPTVSGTSEQLQYYPVTTGFSFSFFRFLEIDLFGTALLGNEYLPVQPFRVGATANVIIKL